MDKTKVFVYRRPRYRIMDINPQTYYARREHNIKNTVAIILLIAMMIIGGLLIGTAEQHTASQMNTTNILSK